MPFRTIEHRPYTDRDWLEPRWVDANLSVKEIAEEAGCDAGTLHYWAYKKFGLAFRRRPARPDDAPFKDKDTLYHHYWELGYSIPELSELWNVSQGGLYYWMRKLGIPIETTRTHGITPIQRSCDNPCSNKEWLQEQFCGMGKPLSQIAREAGCTYHTARYWLRKHEIPITSGGFNRPDEPDYWDKDWLYDQYVTQGKTRYEIACECDVVFAVIERWMRRFEIPTRDPLHDVPWRQKDVLQDLVDTGLNAREIAEELGCERTTIATWIEALGVRYEKYASDGTGNDTTEQFRNCYALEKWRQAVLQRDNWACQMPGCGERDGLLHAHHIKRFDSFPDGRFDVSNGITLCDNCHRLTYGKEEDFELLFKATVECQHLHPAQQLQFMLTGI